jgi:hypothetical protein
VIGQRAAAKRNRGSLGCVSPQLADRTSIACELMMISLAETDHLVTINRQAERLVKHGINEANLHLVSSKREWCGTL